MSALVTVTAPTEYPITVLDAKEHLRVTHTAEDTLIDALIGAATAQAEAYCNRQFCTATYDWFLDSFPSGGYPLEVPRAPLVSITTLKYIDEDGTLQTWGSSNYRVDIKSAPGRVTEAYDVAWPTIRGITNAVEIRYVCGYGAATAVPVAVKHAIKLMVAGMYAEREGQMLTTFSFQENPAVRSLLSTVRLGEFV